MTQWIIERHNDILTVSLTSLVIAFVPDILSANTPMSIILSGASDGITAIKDIIQAMAGLVTIVLTTMVICTKASEFKKWFHKTFKSKKHDRKG